MIKTIIEIALSVATTSGVTALIVYFRSFPQVLSGMKTTQRAIIKDRIVQAHQYHTNKGFIDLYHLDALECMFKEYDETLGGNGFVKELMIDIRELPNKKQ